MRAELVVAVLARGCQYEQRDLVVLSWRSSFILRPSSSAVQRAT
ncbi:hypothetical protein ACWD9K_36205 [Streptomyces sp. 900116325]